MAMVGRLRKRAALECGQERGLTARNASSAFVGSGTHRKSDHELTSAI